MCYKEASKLDAQHRKEKHTLVVCFFFSAMRLAVNSSIATDSIHGFAVIEYESSNIHRKHLIRSKRDFCPSIFSFLRQILGAFSGTPTVTFQCLS